MFTKSAIAFAGRSVLISAMFPSFLFASQPHVLSSRLAPKLRFPVVQPAVSCKKSAPSQRKKPQTLLVKQKVQRLFTKKKAMRNYSSIHMEHRYSHLLHTQTADMLPLGTFTMRAYTHQHPHAATKTATGTLPQPGRTIAVDPRIIPLGTKLYIPGLGERIAEDVGGRIKGKRLDIFLPTVSHCRHFGVQSREVLAIIE